ncbi:CRISPR system precrRNA processing endoribonuclease RAMP protein Cas6 [Desulfurobacterium atlanticum]|uniref:CRISPR-associated protein, Cas6 family n=1 Tax=Desulfurobacterium atlanticum TaxID=240169 RepID=A0A238Y5F0_9BACT|nr:CRISPR system precrRNA processing endoribonuclease RAMP protein Cas6 [Desulfurobacterium atlanticum]SNR65883.1 CRISPR-associated protein, Cas6 family [Desulfurobacterium atlanticum]
MPGRIRIGFKAEEKIPLKEITPDRIHGLFFSLLDKKTAELLHEIKGFKPFTLYSPLFFSDSEETTDFIPLEITFLDDELFSKTTTAVILYGNRKELKLGNVVLKVLRGFKIEENDVISFEKLLENSEPNRDLIMDFVSPTTFKRGKFDYPIPVPELIFKSLLKKWNVFSSVKLDYKEFLEKVGRDVHISGCWIKTYKFEFSSLKKITGFKGRVFLFNSSKDENFRKTVQALVNFATFSGVGRKTTMGFGRIKNIKFRI